MSQYFKEIFDDPLFKEQVPWRIEKFALNDTIIQEGGMSESVYMVLSGCVDIFHNVAVGSDDGRKVGIAKLAENEIFGELSMFDDMPHNASVVAAGNCEIAVINSQALNQFLDQNTEHGYRVVRTIVDTLVKRMRKNNIRTSSVLAWYLQESGGESENIEQAG